MNILIPYSWLKDYIKTNLPAKEVARLLSLHAFAVERIHDVKGEPVFEIEVTTNRGDALSVLGIARELKAVLPKGKFTAKLPNPDQPMAIPKNLPDKDKLIVEIKDKSLVPRFCAIVLENVKIGPSPKRLVDRLEQAGTRSLNNIIDITNYLMLDKGQPMHAFDYDKIKGQKMILRESRQAEKVITLDEIERELPEGVIVIEDGTGRLIDLCGIMGAKNSGIDANTKKVLLFVQVYDATRIRRASMTLGHRTEAALRFEKGIDPAGVLPGLFDAVAMAEELAGAKVSSKMIDIVNEKYKTKSVKIDYEKISQMAGVVIEKTKIDNILKNLGFKIKGGKVEVPSWRSDDIEIGEDLAEEVIRIYGYHNLPAKLPLDDLPKKSDKNNFAIEDSAKNYLKHLGFFECYNNSMTSRAGQSADALELLNPLSQEAPVLRTSLLPQLIQVLEKNESNGEKIRLFELASVFLPKKGDLPDQPLKLAVATKGLEYLELKGILSALLGELNVADFNLEIKKISGYLVAELDFEDVLKKSSSVKKYAPLSKYNSVREDMTFVINEGVGFEQIKEAIESVSNLINKVDFKYIFKNNLTIALEYLDRSGEIPTEQIKKIRESIFSKLEKSLNVKLKV